MAVRSPGLDEFEAFVAVAERLHFGRAADACQVSTSALSKRIRLLEDAVGAPLLERTSRRVRLSEAGEMLVHSARLVLERAGEFEAAARAAADGHAGQVTLLHAINHGAFVAALLGRLHARHPDIQVDFRAVPTTRTTDTSDPPDGLRNEIADAVRRGEASIGLTTAADQPGLASFRFGVVQFDTIVVPIAHPLADRGWVEPEDLAGETFVWAGFDPAEAWAGHEVPFAVRHLPLRSREEYATRIESGQGIAFTASEAVSAIAHRRVVALALRDPATWGRLEQFVVWRIDDPSPVVREVVAAAREVAET